jgi:hypothetical protein
MDRAKNINRQKMKPTQTTAQKKRALVASLASRAELISAPPPSWDRQALARHVAAYQAAAMSLAELEVAQFLARAKK